MKEINKISDHWGQSVIYVGECEKYIYQNPEIPLLSPISLHNSEDGKIYDIIDAVENYFCDSGNRYIEK